MSDVTRILDAMNDGDPRAAEDLLPLVYAELRKLAAYYMANEAPGQTLQPTALVHEAWMNLGAASRKWNNRAHFFAAAAEAMRHILVDNARRKKRPKHGGDQKRENIEDAEIPFPGDADEILAVDEALEQFKKVEPDEAKLVVWTYFGGRTVAEAAEMMGISSRTAARRLEHARAWLYREIQRGQK